LLRRGSAPLGYVRSSAELVNVKVIEVYEEPATIPGTTGEVESKAVTIELSARVPLLEDVQKQTDTAHAFAVGGAWKWILRQEAWAAYSKGACPAE
jgi:hypothetical protein